MIDGRFVLPREVRAAVIDHARREWPHECCGLLVGIGRGVVAAVAMRNVADTPATRFRLDDREHIALRRRLRDEGDGRRIVGVYHSHPAGPARPSARDVAEAAYPEWLYVIVGIDGARARVRGFALEPPVVRPVRLSPS